MSVDDLLVTSSAVCLSGSAAIDGGWLRCDDGAKALRPFEHVGLACCSPGCKPVVCPRVGLTLTARGSDACLLSFDNVPASWIECSRKGWSTTYEPMHMADREAYAIRQIALGAGFVCVLDEVGVTSCWGEAIGSPSAQRPILVGNFRRMRTICATLTEVCGIDEDARVSCASASEVNAHAVLLRGTPVRLACGDRHACAATKEGTVECWGANERGQLGDGTTTPATPTEPRRVKLPPTPAPLPSGTR